MNHEGFTEGDDALLGSRDRALEEEEVVFYDTVVGETTHGSDSLLCDILLRGGVVVLFTEANTVDLLVYLRSVVIAIYNTEALLNRIQPGSICTYFDQHAQRKT